MGTKRDRELLFFSGGDALAETARVLRQRGVASIHLVTPFDSGGSSAALREALQMPAVGDLRNRLVALSARDQTRDPVVALFRHRLGADPRSARESLLRLLAGRHRLLAGLPTDAAGERCRQALAAVGRALPPGFDARAASLGNLVLAGLYLAAGRDLVAAVHDGAEILDSRGRVRPTVDADLHLGARLADGARLARQHLLTGKQVAPIAAPVETVELVDADGRVARASIDDATRAAIASCALVCLPVGSFFSSVVANLLPDGVVEAVAATTVPKVYVPNLGCDPEQLGMGITDAVGYLRALAGRAGVLPLRLVDRVLIDPRAHVLPAAGRRALEAQGVEVVEASLCRERRDRIAPDALVDALLGLAAGAGAQVV